MHYLLNRLTDFDEIQQSDAGVKIWKDCNTEKSKWPRAAIPKAINCFILPNKTANTTLIYNNTTTTTTI